MELIIIVLYIIHHHPHRKYQKSKMMLHELGQERRNIKKSSVKLLYHVIILKASSALIKSCDCKCKIFSRSVRQTATPFRVPSKFNLTYSFDRNKENSLKQIKANCYIDLETKALSEDRMT